MELTKQEELAIELLKKAARHWPESLWLFSASGMLHVVKRLPDGRKAMVGEGFDPDYAIATIDIPNDGGDW